MGAMNLGHVVCCGYAAPVVSVQLTDGKLIIRTERKGPLPAIDGVCTVYGEDGSEVISPGPWLSCERVPRRDIARWTLNITLGGDAHAVVPGNVLESRDEVPAVQPGNMKAITA